MSGKLPEVHVASCAFGEQLAGELKKLNQRLFGENGDEYTSVVGRLKENDNQTKSNTTRIETAEKSMVTKADVEEHGKKQISKIAVVIAAIGIFIAGTTLVVSLSNNNSRRAEEMKEIISIIENGVPENTRTP